MNDGDADLSARARMRAAARERREARARERGDILDLVVSGYTYEAIADSLKLSVKTVRRAAAKAIAQRQLDGGADYVHLQVLRLTKAMRVVDLNLEEGDLKAVEPLLKVIAQLDKYHALSRPAPLAPPPALARPTLALAAPDAVEIGTEKGAQVVEIA
jgi:DNA-binding CsgD family transcriptional regulator